MAWILWHRQGISQCPMVLSEFLKETQFFLNPQITGWSGSHSVQHSSRSGRINMTQSIRLLFSTSRAERSSCQANPPQLVLQTGNGYPFPDVFKTRLDCASSGSFLCLWQGDRMRSTLTSPPTQTILGFCDVGPTWIWLQKNGSQKYLMCL